jgi:hypothetical protein
MEVIGDAVSVWKRSRNVIAILAVLPLVADDLVLFDNCGAQPFGGMIVVFRCNKNCYR